MPRRSSPVRRTARWLALCLTVFAVAGLTWLAYLEHENSTEVAVATPAQLRSSLNRASAWIERNRNAVLHENNPMLWLFVREAAWLANDPQLVAGAQEGPPGCRDTLASGGGNARTASAGGFRNA
jgi:hypothetical protein